ncbi:histidine phosphatase family protein [Acetobacter oeni]|uniref:Phosphoglycerate mutase n=1 Tax=Acetobacter oeni TaxID=304077 RepID=A0A511XKQ2_9PROT|nr:histidine phosphatase family protein [Acetobacter oeni]MBB3883765.1 hypothetical protein [Acetobacter oeni]NHO19889.1 hypothetical protein [Acetobacter oeni]GBR10327.1 phosphoglycerate mutase [Acetobacter oeni LMG 21952]GEN63520.1 hypothetical protein AOE01nite_17440 [Acetobacter oeni]
MTEEYAQRNPIKPGGTKILALASGVPDETRRGIIPARDSVASQDSSILAWLRETRLRYPVIAAPDVDLTDVESDAERPLVRETALRDRDHGQWHGRPLRDLSPEDISRWIMDPDHAAPDGESNRMMLDRAGRWLEALPAGTGDLIVIARPTIIRMMLIHALGGGVDMRHHLDVPPSTRSAMSRHTGWRVSLVGAPLSSRDAMPETSGRLAESR